MKVIFQVLIMAEVIFSLIQLSMYLVKPRWVWRRWLAAMPCIITATVALGVVL